MGGHPGDSGLDGVLEGAQVLEGLGLLPLPQLLAVGLPGSCLCPPPGCRLRCRCCCSLQCMTLVSNRYEPDA